MININIKETPSISHLLSRKEILKEDGIYHDPDYPTHRFVVNRGECFIFGDSNPLYISSNPNMETPRYLKVDEQITFEPIY